MEKQFAEELIKKVLPRYEIKEMIGEGSFGAVFRINDGLKERAVKIILLSAAPCIEKGAVTTANTKIERDFRHIVESYERIECEEIVTVYDFYKVSAGEDKRQSTAYAIVIMELYPANLSDHIIDYFKENGRLLDIETAQSLMEKLANLIGNLYTKRGFLFEDIKPENILVKEKGGDVKLVVGDIGGLKSLGSVSTTSSQVTLSYCAAEVIRKGQKPDLQSIMYSYGLISYFIFEGHLPYEDYGVIERIDLIRDRGLVFSRIDIPHNLKEVIERCLAFEPEERFKDFNEIIDAIHGKAIYERDKFGGETIDVSSFIKRTSYGPGVAKGGVDSYKKRGFPVDVISGMKASASQKMVTETRKRIETVRITDEKDIIDKIDKEIRELVIRSGDMYKLQNESYKVYGDIKIEDGAMLLIDNARLFFNENSGIISSGTLRAKNSVFSAIDPAKKWKNIALSPADTRVNFIEGCKFRFGKGRTWESLQHVFHIQGLSLNDHYLYGGALFIAGVREKIITINNCVFYSCSAQEGGGIYCLKAQPTITNCMFDNCSAVLTGGGMSYVESNASVRNCVLNNCSAYKEGGGISCFSSHPLIEGCIFDGCLTRYLYGGGIYCSGSSPMIKSCKFNRCIATKNGGGIYCDEGSKPKILYPAFTNCQPNNTNYNIESVHFR